jgi:hypothetical protein
MHMFIWVMLEWLMVVEVMLEEEVMVSYPLISFII